MTSAKRFLPSFTLFSAFFFLLPQTMWLTLRLQTATCAEPLADNPVGTHEIGQQSGFLGRETSAEGRQIRVSVSGAYLL